MTNNDPVALAREALGCSVAYNMHGWSVAYEEALLRTKYEEMQAARIKEMEEQLAEANSFRFNFEHATKLERADYQARIKELEAALRDARLLLTSEGDSDEDREMIANIDAALEGKPQGGA